MNVIGVIMNVPMQGGRNGQPFVHRKNPTKAFVSDKNIVFVNFREKKNVVFVSMMPFSIKV